MARKPKKSDAETTEVVASPVEAPKFTPCRQCGNPGDCERRAKCGKGFK
jgi:hypothetical protein